MNWFRQSIFEIWITLSPNEIKALIKKSIELKLEVVQKDKLEKNLRELLNFGHTIGHAIEATKSDFNKFLVHT